MKDCKKILIVASEFPPQPGGIGNHAQNLAVKLSNNNCDVTVITDHRATDIAIDIAFDNELNIKVIRIPRYKLNLRTYLRRYTVYKKFLKNESPSIVFATGKFPLWLVAFGGNISKNKKIAIIHGSEVNLNSLWQRKLVEKSLKRFQKIIAVSNYTKSLVHYLKLDNITVIKNGFNMSKFKIVKSNLDLKGYPKLVTVGNVSRRKGQHNVISKLPELIKLYPEIHYHVVGIPSEREKLELLSKELKVDSYLTFHGMLPQLQLNNLLNKCDIFAMLSENTLKGDIEGFGIALLEANYLGIPTIGSKYCGIEDAINNRNSGILVKCNDTEEFKTAIQEIMEKKDVYTVNAKKWAIKHSWDRVIEKYLKLI